MRNFESPSYLPRRKRNTCLSPVSSSEESDYENLSGDDSISSITQSFQTSLKVDNDNSNKESRFNQVKTRKNKNVVVLSEKPMQRRIRLSTIKTKLRKSRESFLFFLAGALDERRQAALSMSYGFGIGTIIELSSYEAEDEEELDELRSLLQGIGFELRRSSTAAEIYGTNNDMGTKILQEVTVLLPDIVNQIESDHDRPEEIVSIVDHAEEIEYKEELLETTLGEIDEEIEGKHPLELSYLSPVLPEGIRRNSCHLNMSGVSSAGPYLDIVNDSNATSFSSNNQSMDNVYQNLYLEKIKSMDNSQDMSHEGNNFLSPPPSAAKDKRKRNRLRKASILGRRLSLERVFQERRISSAHHAISLARVQEDDDLQEFTQQHASYKIPSLVTSLVLFSEYISLDFVTTIASKVSKEWRKLSLSVKSWSIANYKRHDVKKEPADIIKAFPWGKYLSDGAYKEVFQILDKESERMEAISVMDIRIIEETGNEAIVCQEVQHSLLLSELVKLKIAPNFLRTYEVFLSCGQPPYAYWGDRENRMPRNLSSLLLEESFEIKSDDIDTENALYQYIRMELCDGGDLEEFIRNTHCQTLPVSKVVIPYFFQMVFALYVGREQYSLRHYDVKLLNFFLKRIESDESTDMENKTLMYSFGEHHFLLKLPKEFAYIIKLADYGTADTNLENLDQPITLDQFTTLENTPIDQLLLGDQAKQSYSADTFSLGLCLLHLFTGRAPYEELLETVVCPTDLLNAITTIWKKEKKKKKKSSGSSNQYTYELCSKVIRNDPDKILQHTLYRYLVLFGLPDPESEIVRGNPLWEVIYRYLTPTRRVGRNKQRSSFDIYQNDCDSFSIKYGKAVCMKEARQRFEEIPGSLELFFNMVAYDPCQRPTMYEIIISPLFHSLLVPLNNYQSLVSQIDSSLHFSNFSMKHDLTNL